MAGQNERQMAGMLFTNKTTKSEIGLIGSDSEPYSNGSTTQPQTTDTKAIENELFHAETLNSLHSMNDKLNQISGLTLTDPLQEIDFNDRFTVNKHLFFSLFIGAIFMILGNASFYGLAFSIRFIPISFFSIMLVSCISFIIYGIFCSNKQLDIFLSETLHISDERDKDILLLNWNNKAGVGTVCLLMYGSISVLLLEALYSDILYDATKCEQDYETHKAQCLAVYSTFSQTMPIAWAIYLFVGFNKVKCSAEIKKLKNMVLFKYETAKIIENRIKSDFLDKWQHGKRWEQRRSQWIVLLIFSMLVIVGIQGFLRHDLTSIEIKTALDAISIMIGIFHYCGDAVFWSMLFYHMFDTMIHYDFPYVIMMGLLSPINVNDADDVIAWWELRKFYIEAIGEIYCFSLGLAIFILLLGTGIFGVYLLVTLGTVHTSLTMTYAVGVFISVIATFRMVANAVSYHNVQLYYE